MLLNLNFPLSKGKFLGLMTAGLASATLGLAATPAHAVTLQSGFAGDYAPANWTLNANGGSGSVNTAAAPREALVNEGLTRPQRRNLMADEF